MPTVVPTARGLYDQAGPWQRDSVVLSLYAMCWMMKRPRVLAGVDHAGSGVALSLFPEYHDIVVRGVVCEMLPYCIPYRR